MIQAQYQELRIQVEVQLRPNDLVFCLAKTQRENTTYAGPTASQPEFEERAAGLHSTPSGCHG
jgi:hypothetical protein